jgi:hypothetical protein
LTMSERADFEPKPAIRCRFPAASRRCRSSRPGQAPPAATRRSRPSSGQTPARGRRSPGTAVQLREAPRWHVSLRMCLAERVRWFRVGGRSVPVAVTGVRSVHGTDANVRTGTRTSRTPTAIGPRSRGARSRWTGYAGPSGRSGRRSRSGPCPPTAIRARCRTVVAFTDAV